MVGRDRVVHGYFRSRQSRRWGDVFGAPVQVNSIDGNARVSGEEPPRVALVPRRNADPEVVVVWTAKTGADWRLLSTRSTDGGRTFAPGRDVPGSAGAGSRGWESVAVDDRGRVTVLWLDHRAMATQTATHQHAAGNAATAPKPGPTERAGLSALYFASLDGTKASTLATSVCYCCKTSIAVSGDLVFGVWRHVFSTGHRDIAFTMSRDRGQHFAPLARVSADNWKLDGCPDNGPALAIDAQQRAHVVWPTPADGASMNRMAIFYAVSNNGRTFSPRTRIPTGGPASHPQLVIDRDGSSVVVWDEIVDGTRQLGATRARVNAAGAVTFSPLAVPNSATGQWYPSIAVSSEGPVAAWVRQMDRTSVIAVSRLR